MKAIGDARGKTLPQVAINWCLCKDTTPIPGVKSTRQLEDNLGALGWRLSAAEVAALDEVSARGSTRIVHKALLLFDKCVTVFDVFAIGFDIVYGTVFVIVFHVFNIVFTRLWNVFKSRLPKKKCLLGRHLCFLPSAA